jgi:threonine dehydrogenase-like Zn-dependent dehydrogenase
VHVYDPPRVRALTFDGTRAEVREVPDPEPVAGEALVRVVLAGICNTDLEIVRGYMGFRGVLGHELLGVIEHVEGGDASRVGERVTAEINLGCGTCDACAHGLARHCAKRTVMGILGRDGCFAERVALPVQNLHPVPEGVPDEAAVFTEPLAAAFEILEQIYVAPTDRVLVLGDGKLGLLCTEVLATTGAAITLAGRHAAKMRHAERCGARTADVASLGPGGFDVVVEATGSPAGLAVALERTRPRGTLVLKSTFHGTTEIAAAKIVIDEVKIVGSRCGPFAPALAALGGRAIDPLGLLDDVLPLASGAVALERAATKGALKIAVRP